MLDVKEFRDSLIVNTVISIILSINRPCVTPIAFRADFSDQFRKIIIRHKPIDYDLNVMQQSACLVINPITVDSFVALFKCTPVDSASDFMMVPT